MIKVKICGITNVEDALLACRCGADVLGFIFFKKSPRYIKPQVAKKIISQLGPFVVTAGVFIDEKKDAAYDLASYLDLDILQFHGNESSSYCHYFKPKFKVIKVFFPSDRPFREKCCRYRVDAFLFDIRYKEKLQGAKTLSVDILREIFSLTKEGHRGIISGGLNVKNILKTKKFNPYAVDVSRGVEKFIGKKDEKLVQLFIKIAKETSDYEKAAVT